MTVQECFNYTNFDIMTVKKALTQFIRFLEMSLGFHTTMEWHKESDSTFRYKHDSSPDPAYYTASKTENSTKERNTDMPISIATMMMKNLRLSEQQTVK